MRPTISSSNKSSPKPTSASSTPLKSLQNRRISSAVSTGDIQQALHDSSSSEEAGQELLKSNVKARVLCFEKSVSSTTPTRNIFSSSPKVNVSRRSLFNSPATTPTTSDNFKGSPDTNKVLSRASCELAIESLKASVDQLFLLQRRLAGGAGASESESNLSDRERAELLQYLSTSVAPIVHSLKALQFPPSGVENDKLPLNVASVENNPIMIQMMQQNFDKMLSLIQQRMGSTAPSSPR